MKLITWNCQGAFRKKANAILVLKPDILIVQECEHPDKLIFDSEFKKPTEILWFCDNPNKGLGVFSYGKYSIEPLKQYNSEIKFIAPIKVCIENIDLVLFAIWANHKTDPDGQYIEQVWKAIHFYEEHLKGNNVILAGDFNSNTIWDRPRRIGNHSDVVNKLTEKNIHSIYHIKYKQIQGKEKHPTFHLQKNLNKPYHIDYVFASNNLVEGLKKIEVGTFDQWKTFSDHIPLIVKFNI
jgi:exodeoxyribonuclease-3